MTRRPPTWGTTARLAVMGLIAILVCVGATYALVLDLALSIPPGSEAVRAESLRTVGGLSMAAVAALAGVAGIGSGMHGARHVGGPPAPTSAELTTAASVEVLP